MSNYKLKILEMLTAKVNKVPLTIMGKIVIMPGFRGQSEKLRKR